MSDIRDKAEASRASWQYRILHHTKGNQTKIGALIAAMLGYALNPPSIGTKGCIILMDGGVMVNGWKRNEDPKSEGTVYIVGTTTWVRDEFNRLADEIKFNDLERTALFTAFQKWILRDWRAKSELR